jgi:integrase
MRKYSMATITKRVGTKSTTFKAIIRMKNQKAVSKSFARKTDAKDWATKTEADIKAGRYGLTNEAEKHTMSDMIDRYFKTSEPKASKDLLRWWDKEIGHMTLNQVARATIIECRDKLATEKTGTRTRGDYRAPSSVNRYLANLSIVFSHAVEWEWVDINPVKGIKRGKEVKRVRFLGMKGYPETEATDLLDACKNNDDPQLYAMTVMAMNTGCRSGELLGMDWQDIDFKRGTALLTDTKNGESRTIPINDNVIQVLKELRGDGRIGKIFPPPEGATKYKYYVSFKVAMDEAGIKNFKFHDLRHHAASMLAIDHVPIAEIAHLLGHKTLDMAMRYAHLNDEIVVELGAKLNKLNFPS